MVSQVTARPRRGRSRGDIGPPAPCTKTDVVTEFRTAEILRAAGRVLAERGFERATVAEIAGVAGIAKGTVYLYFPSKEHLYSAVLRRSAAELTAAAASATSAAPGTAAQVRAFVECVLGYFEDHRDLLRLHCAEAFRARGRAGVPARRADEGLSDLSKVLEALLRRGASCRSVRRLPPEAAAAAALDIVRGVAWRRLREGGRASLGEDAALAVGLIWKGIGVR